MEFKILFQKNFIILMIAKAISFLGINVLNFALSLYVLNKTGSATAFASVVSIAILPRIFLGPFAGVFIDMFDKKSILIFLEIINICILIVSLLVYIKTGMFSMIHIFLLVISISSINVFIDPCITSIIPQIVSQSEIINANGINSLLSSIMILIYPLIGSILISLDGLYIVYLLTIALMIVSLIFKSIVKIPRQKSSKINSSKFKKEFIEGITFIKTNDFIKLTLFILVITNLLINPLLTVGLPYIIKEFFEFSNTQYGTVESIIGFSMIIAPFISSFLMPKWSFGKSLSYISIGIGLICITLSGVLYFYIENKNIVYYSIIFAGCLITVLGVVINIIIQTYVQKIVPFNMLGRVYSTSMAICLSITPIGQLIFGLAVDKINPIVCMCITGGLLIISILSVMKSIFSVLNVELEAN
ncbi:MFS transporter [Paraclostridium bifermentans]|uniref:MFS transporter n=1 Tax=Paraclostridium bifermentans TaxID=1490 RepID=UPI00359C3493